MQLEAVIIMIVGIVSLTAVRLIVALVGREHAADHRVVSKQSGQPGQPGTAVPPPRVRRGTGRNHHLLYFDPAPAVVAVEVPAARDASPRRLPTGTPVPRAS